MRKNAKTNLYNIFLNGYLGLFATHGSQHLVDPSSGVKILSLVTLNARVPGGSGSAGTFELPIEVLSPPTDDLAARELHMPHVHDLASEFEANGKDHSQGKFIVLMTSKTSSKTLKPKEVGQMLKTDDFGSKVARYIGNRQNITNANTTINTQLDNYRLLRKEYEMMREIDDKRLEGEGDEEEFSYKRWSSESKDDLVTDPVMKEKYSRFSYLWKSCGFALKRNPENGQLGPPSHAALFKATVMRKYDIWKAVEELMEAFQSGSLEMPEQGSILKLLDGLKIKSTTKPAHKKDAFLIRECNKIFKSRCLDRGYRHFTKKLALQAGIDCYLPDSEEADQSLKPHFPEQVLEELTATSHARWEYPENCKFIWFLTDQALPHAMAAISERDMQFKVFYWSKNRGNCAGDRFTSDGEIFLMCWPPGHQLDIFKDPTEPERYTTNPYCARIPSSNMFRLESTDLASIVRMQDLAISRKARIQTPDSVILVEKDDTQHEGAVTRIKEWLALSKDEADALEDRKLGTFPRKAGGGAEDGEEEEEEAKEPLAQELSSLAHVGKSIAAGQDDGHATEENEQAEASEDVANPVGEDDDDEEEEEEEEEEGEGEEEEGEEEETEEEEEEEEEEEGGHSSSEAADSECDDDVDDDASSDADDDALGD
eukprot:jgi/Tetstr1/456559/TSEL_043279.t1